MGSRYLGSDIQAIIEQNVLWKYLREHDTVEIPPTVAPPPGLHLSRNPVVNTNLSKGIGNRKVVSLLTTSCTWHYLFEMS